MWAVSSRSKAKKPLHHISINPFKDERLNDTQILKIVERCEQKYGYKPGEHQRVIVEHIKDGRQHFHVMWNRIDLSTGKAVWPGLHWKLSKEAAREMEKELGLRQLGHKHTRFVKSVPLRTRGISKYSAHSVALSKFIPPVMRPGKSWKHDLSPRPLFRPAGYYITRRKKRDENRPDPEYIPFRRPEWDSAELQAWAWANGRLDILASFGIYLPPDFEF